MSDDYVQMYVSLSEGFWEVHVKRQMAAVPFHMLYQKRRYIHNNYQNNVQILHERQDIPTRNQIYVVWVLSFSHRCQHVHSFYEVCAPKMCVHTFMSVWERMLKCASTLLEVIVLMESRYSLCFLLACAELFACAVLQQNHVVILLTVVYQETHTQLPWVCWWR